MSERQRVSSGSPGESTDAFGDARPVQGLVDPRWKVEIEAEAIVEG